MRIEILLAIAATVVWLGMITRESFKLKFFKNRIHTISNAEYIVEFINLKLAVITVLWIMTVLGLFNKM